MRDMAIDENSEDVNEPIQNVIVSKTSAEFQCGDHES
jgi:hypothetical protein